MQFCPYSHAARTDDHFSTSQLITGCILTGSTQPAFPQACSKTLYKHCHAGLGLLQKGYGQCSASFMLTTSSANPNGFCANTCGRCNCTSPVSSSIPAAATNSPVTVSSTISSPEAMPSSPQATLASPGAVPGSPVSTVKSPAVPTLGPPAPLSAAYLANCDCTDVPPSGTTCPALVRSAARLLSGQGMSCNCSLLLHNEVLGPTQAALDIAAAVCGSSRSSSIHQGCCHDSVVP